VDADLDAESATALEAAIGSAQSRGADIVPIDLRHFGFVRLRKACLLAVEVEAMTVHRGLDLDADGFSPEFADLLRWGARQPLHKVENAYAEIAEASNIIGDMMSGITALILPAVPKPAFSFTAPTPADIADFMVLANVSGMAAITVPIGLSADGLPLALQCLGPRSGGVLAAAAFLADCAKPAGNPPGWGLS
jgi:Asp-tRNA(Asn)/Glu-tRNA(Gln) amidotransferase A subunit family amidase